MVFQQCSMTGKKSNFCKVLECATFTAYDNVSSLVVCSRSHYSMKYVSEVTNTYETQSRRHILASVVTDHSCVL